MPRKDSEARRVFNKAYYDGHRDQILAKIHENLVENGDQIRARRRLYQQEHGRDKRLSQKGAYRQRVKGTSRYKGLRAVIDARRRARKRGLPDTLTAAQWEAIQRVYDYCCAYCGKKPVILTQDHVLAVTKDGGTVISNIVPACGPCNSSKGNREPANVPVLRLLL